MHTLFKPSGKEMKVNDNSLKYALSIGWTEKNPTAVEECIEENVQPEVEAEEVKEAPKRKGK